LIRISGDAGCVRVYDRILYLIEIRIMLAVGTRAPEFTLPDQDGRDVSLTTLLNRGSLVLFFYPADFTPGCTREVCTFRDLHTELVGRGLSIAGISPQGPESHRAFQAKYSLPFTLLSDPGKSVITMYDVMGPLGIGVRRATYLVDPARHIRDAVLADFRITRHEDFVRRAMALSRGHT
jgi:peroxiredoxin Q/BCP